MTAKSASSTVSKARCDREDLPYFPIGQEDYVYVVQRYSCLLGHDVAIWTRRNDIVQRTILATGPILPKPTVDTKVALRLMSRDENRPRSERIEEALEKARQLQATPVGHTPIDQIINEVKIVAHKEYVAIQHLAKELSAGCIPCLGVESGIRIVARNPNFAIGVSSSAGTGDPNRFWSLANQVLAIAHINDLPLREI